MPASTVSAFESNNSEIVDDPQGRLTPSTPTTPTSPRALDLQQMGVTVTATRSTSTRTQVEFDQPQPGCSHWSTPSTTSTSRSQNSQDASITKMFEHVSSMKEGGSKYSSVTQSILYFIWTVRCLKCQQPFVWGYQRP